MHCCQHGRLFLFLLLGLFCSSIADAAQRRPNVVLVMADDQGWGQTGYNHHPILKTPHLDEMAAHSLRFDRFYAAAPVCSPTRASVLTGRTNMRTGVNSHGYALRRQERTIAQALQAFGYATGHFGKWHLNGMRGPGVPIFADDTHHPGTFGFDEWLSVTNFFDRNPIMSRMGTFEEFEGDSSEIIVDEALKFIKRQAQADKPFLSVIWYGTPHDPFWASDEDKRPFGNLDRNSEHHHGELVAMDRSIGTLRQGLRELGIAENTILWFCSDNGGLPRIKPDTTGGLRGHKTTVYEGGLRVPGLVEWPGQIKPRVTQFPAVVMDIFPTIAAIVGLPETASQLPQDGLDLTELFQRELGPRPKPIPFQCFGNTVLLDNNYKLLHVGKNNQQPKHYELYDLASDPQETNNLYESRPELAAKMTAELKQLQASIGDSVAGKDYAEGKLLPGDPEPRSWIQLEQYRPFLEAWSKRPEYSSRIKRGK